MKPLTPRQRQVVKLASLGFSTKASAVWLGISYHTVRTHRDAAMRKLHVHTMSAAVALVERGAA